MVRTFFAMNVLREEEEWLQEVGAVLYETVFNGNSNVRILTVSLKLQWINCGRRLELVLVLLFILMSCIVIICSFIVEHNNPLDSVQLGVPSTAVKRSVTTNREGWTLRSGGQARPSDTFKQFFKLQSNVHKWVTPKLITLILDELNENYQETMC